jgi:hypothetical protein
MLLGQTWNAASQSSCPTLRGASCAVWPYAAP